MARPAARAPARSLEKCHEGEKKRQHAGDRVPAVEVPLPEVDLVRQVHGEQDTEREKDQERDSEAIAGERRPGAHDQREGERPLERVESTGVRVAPIGRIERDGDPAEPIEREVEHAVRRVEHGDRRQRGRHLRLIEPQDRSDSGVRDDAAVAEPPRHERGADDAERDTSVRERAHGITAKRTDPERQRRCDRDDDQLRAREHEERHPRTELGCSPESLPHADHPPEQEHEERHREPLRVRGGSCRRSTRAGCPGAVPGDGRRGTPPPASRGNNARPNRKAPASESAYSAAGSQWMSTPTSTTRASIPRSHGHSG